MSEWQLIETPPDDGQMCLIGSTESDCVLMALYKASLWFTDDGNPEPIIDVTHWMPLPRSPQ